MHAIQITSSGNILVKPWLSHRGFLWTIRCITSFEMCHVCLWLINMSSSLKTSFTTGIHQHLPTVGCWHDKNKWLPDDKSYSYYCNIWLCGVFYRVPVRMEHVHLCCILNTFSEWRDSLHQYVVSTGDVSMSPVSMGSAPLLLLSQNRTVTTVTVNPAIILLKHEKRDYTNAYKHVHTHTHTLN